MFRGRRGSEQREGKQFFFEKKNQKTFVSWAPVSGKNRDSAPKVFLRKEGLALLFISACAM
jgi:hypothetical protein